MIKVHPDIIFIEELKRTSGSKLTTCMQCGACTAVCELSTDQNVFPRRQMILAAWGMKEQLMVLPPPVRKLSENRSQNLRFTVKYGYSGAPKSLRLFTGSA